MRGKRPVGGLANGPHRGVTSMESLCPVRFLADWLLFTDWLSRYRDRYGRPSTPSVSAPLFVGLARARFGLRMASPRITAACKRGLDGKNLPPRKGGARLYVMNGVAREAAQELGGWESPAVMESVYAKVRSGEAVPEMRPPVTKACNVLEVTSFAERLDRDVGLEGDDALGLLKGAAARIWRRRSYLLREFLAPEEVVPVRGKVLALMGRRVRPLNLSDSQRRVGLLRARDFRLTLMSFRKKEPASFLQARGKDAAVSSSPGKRSRQF